MKEEQRNLTLGQVADMKKNLEENIKNQLLDFMNQTGCNSLDINGWFVTSKNIDANDTITSKTHNGLDIKLSI